MNREIKISFIVPCKNEEDAILFCIDSIIMEGKKSDSFEIIIIDNGSTDRTLDKLSTYSDQVKLIVLEKVTISQLRNYGASVAKYNWLAFIDADVELMEGWFDAFRKALQQSEQDGIKLDAMLLGATYSNPPNPTWVQDAWYLQLMARDEQQNNYINGGNLVVNKKLFERVGGFDLDYQTGEDVRFCDKSVSKGARIVKEKSMRAAHYGYPRTLKAFFNRERWHGLGMAAFLGRPWQSRDISLAFYYLFLIPLVVGGVIVSGSLFKMCFLGVVLLVVPILPLSIKRSKKNPKYFLALLVLFVVYGFARSFSLLDIARNFTIKRY